MQNVHFSCALFSNSSIVGILYGDVINVENEQNDI